MAEMHLQVSAKNFCLQQQLQLSHLSHQVFQALLGFLHRLPTWFTLVQNMRKENISI